MATYKRHLLNRVAGLEEPRDAFMSQVVKAQILYLQCFASAREEGRECCFLVWEDQVSGPWLALHDVPGLAKQWHDLVISDLFLRVLAVSDYDGPIGLVNVAPA